MSVNPNLSPGNPWMYPGAYVMSNTFTAYPNETTEAEEAHVRDLLARHEDRMSVANLAIRALMMGAVLGTTAYAAHRGNSIPASAAAGVFWPVYLLAVGMRDR